MEVVRGQEWKRVLPDPDASERPFFEAAARGELRYQRCPACGKGRLFSRYLKVEDACPGCGEALHHHRAVAVALLIRGCAVSVTGLIDNRTIAGLRAGDAGAGE